ncbi:hypothetical protein GCM10011571_02940 [Marinithermofilum abyssi]|uniref:ATP synthase I chain n=1 Tax=Marinithermofilum abyssi TaxID=1571185 RepID=A0A8J2VF49_9BACL|nr:ATP synthase subunit I [Marinithermofilum abyssi]GGE05289.1 hypothetical protein GCM10011571_02940 [Marinithermofilum abyssi]
MIALERRRWRVTVLSLVFVAIFSLLWLSTPFKPFFGGLILGALVSLYNVINIAKKVRTNGEAVLSGKGRGGGTGLIYRIMMVVFSVILVARYPAWFDFRSLLLGLPISYVLLIAVEFWSTRRNE